jgi:hypothetical protein
MGLTKGNRGELYGIVAYMRGPGSVPSKLTCDQPVDAVIMAIEYLRQGYHVLLTDRTVAKLAEHDGAVDVEWLGKVRQAGPPAAGPGAATRPAAGPVPFTPPPTPHTRRGRAWAALSAK